MAERVLNALPVEEIRLRAARGDDITLGIAVADDSGAAIDLTDCILRYTARMNAEDEDAVIEVEVDTHTDAADGESEIPLSASDLDLDAGEYAHDLELEDAGGKIRTLFRGTLEIVQDVTRYVAP